MQSMIQSAELENRSKVKQIATQGFYAFLAQVDSYNAPKKSHPPKYVNMFLGVFFRGTSNCAKIP